MSLAYEQSFASLPSSPISSYQLQPKCLRAFRYSLLIGGLLLSVLFAGRADAQTSVQNDSNNTAVGFPEGGAFSGSDIDNVQMNNGNLHVTIPLWSAPGRGGVGQTYAFTYDTKGFYLSLSGCTDASTPCNYGVLPEQGHTMIMGVNGAAAPGISNRIGFRQVCEIAPPYFTIYSGVAAREWNGTKHAMAPGIYTISASSQDCWATANSTFYASDGSGWAGTYQNFVSKSGGDPDLSDTNGNTTGNLGLPASTGLTYTDANGVHQTIGVTTEVVAISTHLCVPSLQQPASNGSCTEYSASWTVPHIITLPNGLRYTIEYVQNDQGQISSITLPTGAVISYSYQTSPSGTFDGKRVASRTVTVGSQVSTWNYTFNAADSAGNLASSVKDPSQASITYTCTPIESLYSSAGVDVLNPAPCYMTKEVHTDASGNPLETITTDYDQRVTGAPVPIRNTTTWVGTNQVKKIEMDYETITAPMFPNGSAGPSTAPVTWGNVSALREYDWGTGAPGSLLRQTLTSYLHTDTTVNPNANRTAYLARNIADRPTAIIIKDGSGTIVAQTKYFYDEGGLISTSSNPALNHDYTNFSSNFMIRGNLTRVQRWLNTTSTWLTTSYAYDDLGNKRTMTDPNGNVTSYDYTDSFTGASCNQTGKPTYAFLTTVTSPAPFNFLTKYSYYGCTGQLASVRDQNDINANRGGKTFSYDLMKRLITTAMPDGGSTTTSYTDSVPLSMSTSQIMSASQKKVTSRRLDVLGRPSHESTDSDPQGATAVDTSYDLLGRVKCVTNPYRGSPGSSTCTNYDALGRKQSIINQDSTSITFSYAGNTTKTKDEAGNAWTRTIDGIGRLVSVIEPGALTTTYTYNILGDLLCADQWATAASGQPCTSTHKRSFSYDSLSRLYTSSNPETGTICYGTWSGGSVGTGSCQNGYDGDGNLLSKVDARGATVAYSYDHLNRLIKKTFSDGRSPFEYFYDVSGHGASVGRLTHTSNDVNVASDPIYDPVGRVLSQTYCIPSDCSFGTTVSELYDLAGNMTDLTYPDKRHIHQAFDSASRLSSTSLIDIGGVSATQSYVQSVTYNPDNSVNVLTLGNGVQQTITKNNRLQVQTLSVATPLAPFSGSPFLSHTYCYASCATGGTANNGNTWGIVDSINATRTQGFAYDGLNRISSFSVGGVLSQQYSIDAFGNLTGLSGGSPISTFDSATNRINNLPCAKSTAPYDAAGDQLCDTDAYGGVRQYTFDAEGRTTQIAVLGNNGNPFATYVYGGDGNRARKTDGVGNFTEYVNFNGQDVAEKNQAGLWTDYIYAMGQKIAAAGGPDVRLHVQGTACSNCGWQYTSLATGGSANGRVVKTGDHLVVSEFQTAGTHAGVGITFTDGTYSAGLNMPDQDGNQATHDNMSGQWHNRSIDLSAQAGKTVSATYLITDGETAPGSWSVDYRDFVYMGTDETVTKLLTGSGLAGAWMAQTSGETSVSASAVPTGPYPSGAAPLHFYLGDHLGSAQMELAAGGWPVWQGQFAPFGAQIDNQVDGSNYKFTGKERDTESGLDYFGARYYSSSMGRFMSPDWSARPAAVPYADLMNPQSLNLYEYEYNNPLAKADADGHCPICVAVVAVAVGVAIYKGYKAWQKFEASAKKAQDSNARLSVDIINPAKNPDQVVQQNTQANVNAMQDGANAATATEGAAVAVLTAGDAAVSGAAEALANPSNAADTIKDSMTESLQQTNEVQQTQVLPEAPTPQPTPPPPPPPPPQNTDKPQQ